MPILNKMLAAGGISGGIGVNRDINMPNIVRVETSTPTEDVVPAGNLEIINEPNNTDPESGDKEKEVRVSVSGSEDVGKGVARKFLGDSLFRGFITKFKEEDDFFVRFSHDKKLKMDGVQVKHGRRLFEKEVEKLVRVGVPKIDASSLDEHTSSASMSKVKVRIPILEAGDDDPEEYERIFEEKFDGEVPNAIVGIEFPPREVYFTGSSNNSNPISILLYEKVLKNLAKNLIVQGVESARNLYNLELMESRTLSTSKKCL